ncbi:UDP-N-acetylglucosamine--N-acetylmuramyl-(pentapeptide) pyrophosphoryl-undecaprenol N-acetylglucosamine transferase [hydrothermal vent metagenome]|uniref:UDP-N-acetylglucosamine--N-acetylmuramyl-(Pentapeptide) pyrophosphoryl-undecaprenol N-acetylglucosamine transferase n=1 Tax=hydrothermal vent metagenome TaxID=652676 RepID=A0A1W1C516_9ZZZZ
MKLCITGGGTGGHLAIAKAVAKEAKKMHIECIYIGSTSGQDRDYFENSDLFSKTYFLHTTGVVNKQGLGRLKALFLVFQAFVRSLSILKKEGVDAVFSVGGFSAAPASFAAIALSKPLYIHEQNAKTGRLNALLKKYATEFFSSYDENSPIKAYPVQESFFDKARERKDIKTVIFLGGSQGAKAINDLALKSAKELQKRGIHIIHQTGKADYDRVKEAYRKSGIDAEIYSFSKELDSLMQRADLAISRSGASTLWELVANALPALFIPYPYAASDHQYYNAKYLVDNDLAWLQRESDDPEKLLYKILDEDLSKKSKALMQLSKKDGAKEILKFIKGEIKR